MVEFLSLMLRGINVKELIHEPQKTPFNDAFNNWLGRRKKFKLH